MEAIRNLSRKTRDVTMIEQKPSFCVLVYLIIADQKITLSSDLDFCKNGSFPQLIFLMKQHLEQF